MKMHKDLQAPVHKANLATPEHSQVYHPAEPYLFLFLSLSPLLSALLLFPWLTISTLQAIVGISW